MTITPHPRSFFGVSCLIQEHFEHLDYCMATDRPVLISDDAAAERILRYYASASLRSGAELYVETELRSFLPKGLFSDARVQSFAARYSDTIAREALERRRAAGLRKFGDSNLSMDVEGKDDTVVFRSRRETSTSIIVGAYLSLPDSMRTWSRGAELLNQGIEDGQTGVNDGHIRNGLFAGARQAHRHLISGNGLLVWVKILLDFNILLQVWAQIQDHLPKSKRNVASIDKLRTSGILEEWRAAAEENVVRENVEASIPSEAAQTSMLRMHVQDLQRLHRRRAT